MTILVESMANWPVATQIHDVDAQFFSRSSSGYERCLIRDIEAQKASVELGARFSDCSKVIVLGIGGSAMGLRALVDALATPEQARRLILLDHLDLVDALHGARLQDGGVVVGHGFSRFRPRARRPAPCRARDTVADGGRRCGPGR